MRTSGKHVRIVSRRDALKVCLVPAGLMTARVLGGCSTKSTNNHGGAVGNGTGGDVSGGAGAPASLSGTGGSAQASGSAGMQPGSANATGGAQANSAAGARASTGGAQASAGSGGSGMQGASGAGAQAMADAGMKPATDAGSVAGPGVPWATGGTKSIKGGYPDPFGSAAAGTACVLYPAQTIGPCYAQMPAMRADISDGLDGLPIRLSFLVVHTSGCTPVSDATVDIWHSGSAGIYSAYAMGTVCNPGTDDVLKDMFCRGVQTTDADGRVDFSTVFPGWYKGRTIHIHFTIRLNGREAVTSQLYFEDALSDEILGQGLYAARGKRDTNNTSDSLFKSGGAKPDQVLFSTAKRPDGVLHAWKVLSIG